tara:strand:+ start:387 stop:644 length:258 start_codon:yes stop_codon:yes gene_type:complete
MKIDKILSLVREIHSEYVKELSNENLLYDIGDFMAKPGKHLEKDSEFYRLEDEIYADCLTLAIEIEQLKRLNTILYDSSRLAYEI